MVQAQEPQKVWNHPFLRPVSLSAPARHSPPYLDSHAFFLEITREKREESKSFAIEVLSGPGVASAEARRIQILRNRGAVRTWRRFRAHLAGRHLQSRRSSERDGESPVLREPSGAEPHQRGGHGRRQLRRAQGLPRRLRRRRGRRRPRLRRIR
jgi:hypothetical protein